MCEAICIGNTQQTFKKILDGNISDLLRLIKNGQKPDQFSAHFEKNFDATTSHIDLRKYMKFKLVKQLNSIGKMEIFTKPNCNLYMEEHLTILKSHVKNASRLRTRNWRYMGLAGTKN